MIRTTAQPPSSNFNPLSLATLFDELGFTQAVDQAMEQAGKVDSRRCCLSYRITATLVVVLSIYRHLSIPDVFKQILNWHRGSRSRLGLKRITDEAICHARKRLGWEPMRQLFLNLTSGLVIKRSFRSHRTFVVDGVRLSMPDTKKNVSRFGRWKSSNGARTAFPQLLAVCLVSLRNRQVVDVDIQRCTASEKPSCPKLFDKLKPNDLLLLDRGFHAYWIFKDCLERGVHFVCRATTSYKPRRLKILAPGDYLVSVGARIKVPKRVRRQYNQTHSKETTVLRMIEYRVSRKCYVRLLTDLLDPAKYPAMEIAQLYHERWGCETAFKELKVHLASPGQGTLKLALRSKTPDGCLKEAFGLFIAYNLLRGLIAQSVANTKAQPTDLSFKSSLTALRMFIPVVQSSIVQQQRALIRQFFSELRDTKLKRRRRPRTYPRVVKVKIIRYPRKRAWHRQRKVDFPSSVRLVKRYSRGRAAA